MTGLWCCFGITPMLVFKGGTSYDVSMRETTHSYAQWAMQQVTVELVHDQQKMLFGSEPNGGGVFILSTQCAAAGRRTISW